jgi:hypothetical protein
MSTGNANAPRNPAFAASAARWKSFFTVTSATQIDVPVVSTRRMRPLWPGDERLARAVGLEFANLRVVDAPAFDAVQLVVRLVEAPARAARPVEPLAHHLDDPADRVSQGFGAPQVSRHRVLDGFALLGLLALGDVDDGADEAGDLVARPGKKWPCSRCSGAPARRAW